MEGTQKQGLQESEFVKLLVRSRVISEAQLKAVYDYQRSVGGSVLDILVKLNMLPRSDIDRMLQAAMRGEDIAVGASGKSIVALDAQKLDVEALKLHHRLIDKIPGEIVERCILTVCFPMSNLDTRKLIVGHGRELPEGLAERIATTLGIELYTLRLDEDVAADLVVQYLDRAKKPIPEGMMSLCAERRKAAEARMTAAKEAAARAAKAKEVPVPGGSVTKEELVAAGASPERVAVDSGEMSPGSPLSNSAEETNTDDTRADLDVDPTDDPSTDSAEAGAAKPAERTDGGPKARNYEHLNIEWTALINVLVKKSIVTHEEIRVEVELLKRSLSRY